MDILIIGGSNFIGPSQVETALAQGHHVTLFNRGKTNPNLFPEVEKLHGDRDGHLDALHGRTWDVVIDNCGYVPRIVQQSADLLKDAVGRYVFISTLSVYSETDQAGLNEDSALATLDDDSVEEVTGATYGGLKVLCEQVVQRVYGDRALIIRPGLIVGPHDPTHRFTYWPVRIADSEQNGGEVLAPGQPDYGVQFIDARDLVTWTIHMATSGGSGVYNATGPDYKLTMGTVLETCRELTSSPVRFTWVDDAFLLENEVAPYSDMPLWVPADVRAFSTFDIRKAVQAGLSFRPLAETITDTLDWEQNREHQPDERPRSGLSAEREAELLEKWHARS